MTNLRRILVLGALLFWQGGFIFYTSIVVPIGTDELGSLQQGFITRRVTINLNIAGAVALGLLALDLLAADPSPFRRGSRAFFWLGMALAQIALFYQHAQLDALLRPESMTVIDKEAFRFGHRIYLWISTTQWALAVAFVLLTPAAWRAQDQRENLIKIPPGRDLQDE